jgi:hypothetical protein
MWTGIHPLKHPRGKITVYEAWQCTSSRPRVTFNEDKPPSHNQVLNIVQGTIEGFCEMHAQFLLTVVWEEVKESLQPVQAGLAEGDAIEPYLCIFIPTCKHKNMWSSPSLLHDLLS